MEALINQINNAKTKTVKIVLATNNPTYPKLCAYLSDKGFRYVITLGKENSVNIIIKTSWRKQNKN